jgi:hypothetical protein
LQLNEALDELGSARKIIEILQKELSLHPISNNVGVKDPASAQASSKPVTEKEWTLVPSRNYSSNPNNSEKHKVVSSDQFIKTANRVSMLPNLATADREGTYPVIVNGVSATKGSNNKVGKATPVKTVYNCFSKPRKNKNKILIIGDSQARGCAPSKTFEVTGTVIPGSRLDNITSVARREINSLCRNDFVVIYGGTNDISKNESDVGLRYMRKLALQSKHTNIIAVTPSRRYDLPDFSCVNKETQVFTGKFYKILKDMHHVSVVDTDLTRDNYTQHGLHLNSSGNEWIAMIIGQTIVTILTMKKPAISLNWNEVPRTAPADELMTELASKTDKGNKANVVRSSCRTKRPPIIRHEDFLWVTCTSKTV